MNQAMRAGIREVVSTDDASALAAACQRSIELSRQMRLSDAPESGKKLAKVLIVFSAKGGCGKTTVSTNLAHVLAQRPNQRVCLVDFDLQFGDVGVALQIKPTKSMSDALAMEGSLDKSGVKSMLINYEEQLDVLLAPTNPADVEHISGDLAAAVLSELRSLYDYIVVDSPPAFTEVVLKTFDVADSFILLTTLDLPALKNLRVTIDTLDALGMPREKWNVVVNRSDAHQGLEVEDVENAIGMRVNALIPSSNDVPASINQGVTIVASKPRHPVSRAFAVLANQIFPTNEDPATKPATSWLGWVKRS
jgi:pilus assembly protein CpaE